MVKKTTRQSKGGAPSQAANLARSKNRIQKDNKQPKMTVQEADKIGSSLYDRIA